MSTSVTIYVNTTPNTGGGQDRASVPGNYLGLDLANDKFYFTSGSSAVADGQDEPTTAELNEAATLIESTAVEVPKLIALDKSADLLYEIDGAGSGDDRHVICIAFDGATASIPTLEAWDDSSHSTATIHTLGNGTPANSWIYAVKTTDASPGSSWSGTRIAGTNKLDLDTAPLTGAKDLYFNIYVKIPASYSTGANETPVLTIRYTYN